MKLRTVIIDDEQSCIDSIRELIQKNIPLIEIIDSANDVKPGLELIKRLSPDLVFLDIHMPNGTGFDLLQEIGEINFKVIFTTAFSKEDYLLMAFKFSALHYLLKPVILEDLKEAIDKAVITKEKEDVQLQLKAFSQTINNEKQIIINSKYAIDIVRVEEIVRCSANDNYTEFHLSDSRKLTSSKNLGEYVKLLEGNGFFPIHRSHLVNLKCITKIDKKEFFVLLRDGTKLPFSDKMLSKLLKTLQRKAS